jgi:hypothetical protein
MFNGDAAYLVGLIIALPGSYVFGRLISKMFEDPHISYNKNIKYSKYG